MAKFICFTQTWQLAKTANNGLLLASLQPIMEGWTAHLSFSQQYLQATLFVSLLSVWLLVGLFYYLNRYTKRDYFSVWTVAWLFYALWLTLGLKMQNVVSNNIVFMLQQCCVAISAVFLLWGSARFLSLPVRQTLIGLFMVFLLAWTFVSPSVLASRLQIQLPVFILIGLGSVFAGVCFFRVRKKMPFVGAGMLSVGFLLWGFYLGSYPFTQQHGFENLYNAGFLIAAVLQLFIAVSMIVLVMEEVRYNAEQIRAEIVAVRSEKDALQVKVLTTEEQCKNLYDRVRLSEGVQQAYDELRRTQQVVVQQERLRALGQMASGIAHDINNALSPIVAYSELLMGTLPDLPVSARQHLQTIRQSGDDIAHIVARMREFYRRQSNTEQLVKVDVNRIIEEVTELTRPRWRDLSQRESVSIQVKHELEPNLPLLISDPSDLREAMINLIFNAVDALPRGGVITLVTRTTNHEGKKQLQIEVRDNGIGMDEATRQRCLEPFFSTKAKRGGTGLGLAMVYGMMQRHNGNIEVESSPGHGTCMRLTFPVRGEISPVNSSTETPATKSNRSLRVLCIDDEPQVQELLKHCLATFNHHVETASSGKQGVEMFRQAARDNQPFEIVVTDLGMSDIDGRQVARTIKKEFNGTPVIMMTGWGTMMHEDGEAIPEEVDALIGKPPRIKELNELLLRFTPPEKMRT
ncbi:MAG TPA: ATP-binding protein [Verrucomicrobiae bacterium]|nr:ATP-binding protein [Verrucomicrobiae bacterium]